MSEESYEDPSSTRPNRRPGKKTGLLEVLALVLAVVFWAVPANLPLQANGIAPVALVVVTVCVLVIAGWRTVTRSPRHPVFLTVHWLLAALLVVATVAYVHAQGQFLGRGQCNFGIDGYGVPGPVWVEVVNREPNTDHAFTVNLLWGPKGAALSVQLSAGKSIYLTMSKNDVHSPPMDVTATPARDALIGCGTGTPPHGADSRAVVGTDWHHVPR